MVDSPEVVAAKRLLDNATDSGFVFHRIAPGPDGPLRGVRETPGWLDQIILSGFRAPDSCSATRRRRSPLIVRVGRPTTRIRHLLTPDAAAAGRLGGGHYVPLCGAEVIPASMVEPGRMHRTGERRFPPRSGDQHRSGAGHDTSRSYPA